MFFSLNPFFIFLLFFFFTIIFLVFYLLINKVQTITILKKNIEHLNKTLNELDQQAKLIIKADTELKLYQEEVEDKLNKLILLKNLILSSLNILDKNQLFSLINEHLINNIGFKKCLILDFENLEVKVNIGFEDIQIEKIKVLFTGKKDILKTTSLIVSDPDFFKKLLPFLPSKDFLLAPIKARKDIYGIFLLYEPIFAMEIKKAQREFFSIISMYLGQCLDNIKLFEELYRSKDELEKKIKERTNELVKSLRELENISKMKSDFISSVSHELRTPLTSVKGFSSLLVEESFGKLPEEAKKRLQKIDENVDKLVNMVNTLLDISRVESGKMEIKIAPSDIAKLIKDIKEFLLPQIQSKEIEFILDIPEKLLVYMDKNLIERVLVNLINNAIKFTPQGGKITVKCKKEKEKAIVSVSDTGCGIEKENLDKIFQEFFRIDNPVNRTLRGSGLGLSLVRRIIDTHREKIWVESEVGKGTIFYFTLKLA
ncbi:MAG TPA: HAMP domain-containing histidine kinase [Candidatus Omnitrophica bacterium]|nr:HAMP domain-containing histidine kinase [Candidatus Omnitrophota bacterium]